MKVKAKLYDPNEGNRDYKFTADAFEQFSQYMKKSDRIVYDGQEMDELELTHPSLNDAVGKVESIEWVDSCAFGEIVRHSPHDEMKSVRLPAQRDFTTK